MKREALIAYALKYQGNYDRILQAVKDHETASAACTEDCLTILDEDYPTAFLELKEPPFVLFYRGHKELLEEEKIGVVGSRNPCAYALEATEALIKTNQRYVIVSGLAKGIDACAHLHSGKTIGILGCGIDYIYPYCNKELIMNVRKNGLILSEYPGMTKPYASHFPFRNRLIAALSERLYIMQSSARSGTMTSVNEALELGKDVRVLPYDIFMQEGRQNNLLIYEGATPISYEEIAF